MMKFNQITAIGKPLNPKYRTNLVIAVLTALSIIIGSGVQLIIGTDLLPSSLWGIQFGLAVFFNWAIARELDPDHDMSAFVGIPFTMLAFWFFGPPSLLFAFWFLILSRILNRSTGRTPTIIDSLTLFGFSGWLTLTGNWIFGLITALAFYLDSRLSPRLTHQSLFATATFLITVVLFAFRRDTFGSFEYSLPILLGAVGIIAIFSPVLYTSQRLESVDDETGEPLNPRRVQAAQILALATILQIAVWSGGPNFLDLSPLVGALLGISLYRFSLLLTRPKSV